MMSTHDDGRIDEVLKRLDRIDGKVDRLAESTGSLETGQVRLEEQMKTVFRLMEDRNNVIVEHRKDIADLKVATHTQAGRLDVMERERGSVAAKVWDVAKLVLAAVVSAAVAALVALKNHAKP